MHGIRVLRGAAVRQYLISNLVTPSTAASVAL
jgi:hypothetical protein